jgi:hypothetical protein
MSHGTNFPHTSVLCDCHPGRRAARRPHDRQEDQKSRLGGTAISAAGLAKPTTDAPGLADHADGLPGAGDQPGDRAAFDLTQVEEKLGASFLVVNRLTQTVREPHSKPGGGLRAV